MTNASRELEDDIIEYYFTANAPITRPTAWFLALHTAAGANDSTSAWTATEITSTGAYTRPAIAFATTAAPTLQNSASVSFPVATQNWGTATHAAVFTASTYQGGTMLFWININDVTVNSAEQVTVAVNAITCVAA